MTRIARKMLNMKSSLTHLLPGCAAPLYVSKKLVKLSLHNLVARAHARKAMLVFSIEQQQSLRYPDNSLDNLGAYACLTSRAARYGKLTHAARAKHEGP